MGEVKNLYAISFKIIKGMHYLGKVNVYGREILKLLIRILYATVNAEFIWLREKTGSGLLRTGQ
jgi:hypothetical protein